MAVNIVTGMTGTPHITSDDDRARNAAYFGRNKVVLSIGNELEALALSNNAVRIRDGVLMNQGTQIAIEPSDYVDLTIDNGLAGVNRNDLIVMRYTKDANTDLESAELVVIKGTAGSTAVDPEYIEGNIIDGGDLVDDMPLYRVEIRGTTLDDVVTLFDLWDIDEANYIGFKDAIAEKVDKVTGKGLSTNDYTDTEKTKLASIETEAEKNVQADFNQNNSSAADYIKNKPNMSSKMDTTNPTGTGAVSINRASDSVVGNNSVSIGSNNTAKSANSVAIGTDNDVHDTTGTNANNQVLVGVGLKSNAGGQANFMAIGRYNSQDEDDVFNVGCGTADNNRKNAMEVKDTGAVVFPQWIENIKGLGTLSVNRKSNTSVGNNSVAIGAESQATDNNAVAIGEGTLANVNCKNALGKFNNPTSGDLLEVGNGSNNNNRSNAFRVKPNGDIIAGRDVIDGFGNKLSDMDGSVIISTEDNAPFLLKANNHSAVYDTLVGATVSYNQLVENGNFVDTSGWTVPSPIQLTASGNEATLTNLDKETQIFRIGSLENKTQTGHVIIFIASYKKVGNVTGDFIIGAYTSNYAWSTYKRESLDTSWKTIVLVDKPVLEVSTFACGGSSLLHNDSGSELHIKNAMCIDLTLMFGSEIADYVYSLEQAESGTGLEFLQSYGFLTDSYYSYNAGELLSVKPSAKKVVGFNQWDEEWEIGFLDNNGTVSHGGANDSIVSKNYIPVRPNTAYNFNLPINWITDKGYRIAMYDNNRNIVVFVESEQISSNYIFNTGGNVCYIKFQTYTGYGINYNHDICLNISDPTKNGTYGPYHEVVYPLPDTELRGLIKLHNDTDGTWLYANGDVCESTGETERKYGIADLGSLKWAYYQWTPNFFVADFSGLPIVNISTWKPNMICSKYVTAPTATSEIDKTIRQNYENNMTSSFLVIFDSDYSDEASFKTAMSGHYLVYELATPTTEYTAPFTSPQALFKGGTEEFVDERAVPMPVGHESVYIDLPDWMNNQYIDDVRAQASQVPALQNQVSILQKRTAPVYGFHISDSESDPSAKVTYLADSVGMTPAHMDYTNDVFDYGSWADVWFVKNCKPCILNADGTVSAYLDKNNFGKDVDGNWITIIPDIGAVQNVMIEFPKIWYKVVPDANDEHSGSVYISPVKIDDDYKDYAYIDYQGNHKEHFYMPAYNGTLVSGVMRSLSGEQVSKTLTGQQEIDACTANGNGWYTEDAGEIMLINFLLILMGKSTDTQAVYGQGLSTGGTEAINAGFTTGVHDTKGMFYGTNDRTIASGSYGNAVKVFGIENYWGFQWHRYAGDMLVNGVRKIKLCYGNEDGSTSFGFNGTGNGYVNVGATPSGTSGGYISRMKFGHDGMYSEVSSGSSSTNYCDGQWFDNSSSTVYALRSGYPDAGLSIGALCVDLADPFNGSWWNVGAAPSYK